MSSVCKGSVHLGTACGDCDRCKSVPLSVWAHALREMRERHEEKLRELNLSHSEALARLEETVYEDTVVSMARTAVNCGHSSSCAVAGWTLEAINERKLEQQQAQSEGES